MLRRVLIAMVAGCLALAPAAVASPVLPDLVADKSDGAYLVAEQAQLRLRFNGYVHNDGAGPLEVRGDATAVHQRIYESGLSSFVDQLLPNAELSYERADGHRHTHLQRIARYSLVDPTGTAPVAPAQKIGFCLLDSQPMRTDRATYEYDPSSCFPADRVNDPTGPVRMGVSAGWRDLYDASLTHQWVIANRVQPGEYLLRAEIDPDGLVAEAVEDNAPADRPVTIPGYVARPATVDVADRQTSTVALGATAYAFTRDGATAPEPLGTRQFRIDTPPQHGTLNVQSGVWFNGDEVAYTPSAAAGTVQQDSFTFSARDASSPFPVSPAVASTILMLKGSGPAPVDPPPPAPAGQPGPTPVAPGPPLPGPAGDAVPALAISGAPATLVAGTAVQLSANAAEPTWSVDGVPGGGAASGTISDTGLLRAPAEVPAGEALTVTARAGDRQSEVRVRIVAPPVVRPAPAAVLPAAAPRRLALAAVRRAGYVAVTARSARSGSLKISVLAAGRRLKTCSMKVKAGRTYACRVREPRDRKQRVTVVATLRGKVGGVVQRRVTALAATSAHGHGH